MIFYNIEEDLSCYCYDNSDKPIIEVRKIESGESDEITFSANEIIFIISGKIYFTLRDCPDSKLQKGQLVFMSTGDLLRYKAVTNCKLLILRLTGSINLCHMYSIEKLFNEMKTDESPKRPFALDINARLQHFVDSLVETWEDGLKCRYYFLAEITKALTMLRAYYPKEELYRFFYPVLSPDTAFSEYVRMHHLKYRTVKELADSMNMSPQQFSRRFTNIFKHPPYEWMQQERARLIYGEICTSDKPFKKIADDFGFTVHANFIRFCRTAFGTIPSEIRKKEQGKSLKSCLIKK